MAKSTVKLLWAVDPTDLNTKMINQVNSFLAELGKKQNCELYPVYALKAKQNDYTARALGIYSNRKYLNFLSSKSDKVLSKVNAHKVHPLMVIDQNIHNLREASKAINSYAIKKSVHYVLINSHAKTGLAKLFLGSFAESMLNTTSKDLIVLNPNSKVSSLRTILFPTGLSRTDNKYLHKCVSLCKKWGAKLKIFHHLVDVVYENSFIEYQMIHGYYRDYNKVRKQCKELAEKSLVKLKKQAAAKGVPTTTQMKVSYNTSGAEIIKSFSRNYDMIVVHSESKGLVGKLVGSNCRDLIKLSKKPVMILK